MTRHIHWLIVCWDTGTSPKEGGRLDFGLEFTLDAESEKEALRQVKQLVKRKHYWVKSGWRKCEVEEQRAKDLAEYQKNQQDMQLLSLKMMKKIT